MNSAGDANVAVVLLHDPGANRQAEPAGITTTAKAGLEDMFQMVGPDAAAGVGEFDDRSLAMLAACFNLCSTAFVPLRNSNASACRGMPNGVRNQIENNLLQRAFIAHHSIAVVIT